MAVKLCVFVVPGVVGEAEEKALTSLETLNNSSPHLFVLGRSWAAGGKEMVLIN